MHATTLVRAAARTPMIQFIGKRSWPTGPHTPAPHPAAPKEIVEAFAAFIAKSQAAPAAGKAVSTAGYIPLYKASAKQADFEDWEAPSYLWQRPEMTEREMEAVMSGGATDIRTGP
ncbi:uncharacterized protein EHS24_006971 [Apiotrichum porosum]|uniref:Uncharacterized protein n=1 Tax=Apiotrichum porosum TaxID=105984 RepID=A0A427XWM0_9TREE|nr:uncharacterized protein EHS24_006971 [Apiotrichum porosum]RSH83296.1 hypothetical protein EHS24_006971 [Apiotrichum porosum]